MSLAFAVTLAATPMARRAAIALRFYDRPGGYKGHAAATPYLGGVAVAMGFLPAAVLFGGGAAEYAPILVATIVLLGVGTLDDRIGLGVISRITVHAAAGVLLWAGDLGWTVSSHEFVDLVVTVVWVAGIINAFNLMDNVDGATGTVGAVSAAGAAGLALSADKPVLAATGFALAAACAGFLPYNLARPSRIFLGDGGSTVIGFGVASVAMAASHGQGDWALLLVAAPVAGLVIVDTSLVLASRHRRGVPLLAGGRDHLTHRLLPIAGSERRLALGLATLQTGACALALLLWRLEPSAVALAAAGYLIVGVASIAVLERGLAVPKPPEAGRAD